MSSVVKVFQPSGILDGIQGAELRKDINAALETGVDIVLLDFRDITFMNSSGLGTLLAALKIVRKTNSKIYICSINEQVRMIFEMTKMERLFQIYTNREEFKNEILSSEYQLLEHH